MPEGTNLNFDTLRYIRTVNIIFLIVKNATAEK